MEQQQKKKSILSGIQPTGVFTLGNYIGAVKNWGPMQDEFDCAYMIADLHAITVRQDRRFSVSRFCPVTHCCSPAASTRRRASSLSRARTKTMHSCLGFCPAIPSSANCPV